MEGKENQVDNNIDDLLTLHSPLDGGIISRLEADHDDGDDDPPSQRYDTMCKYKSVYICIRID